MQHAPRSRQPGSRCPEHTSLHSAVHGGTLPRPRVAANYTVHIRYANERHGVTGLCECRQVCGCSWSASRAHRIRVTASGHRCVCVCVCVCACACARARALCSSACTGEVAEQALAFVCGCNTAQGTNRARMRCVTVRTLRAHYYYGLVKSTVFHRVTCMLWAWHCVLVPYGRVRMSMQVPLTLHAPVMEPKVSRGCWCRVSVPAQHVLTALLSSFSPVGLRVRGREHGPRGCSHTTTPRPTNDALATPCKPQYAGRI